MNATFPTSPDAALRRPLWLALGGALLLAVGGLIAAWGVGSLPPALIALAAGAAVLLRTPDAPRTDEPEADMTSDLQTVSLASLLTLLVLQLAA